MSSLANWLEARTGLPSAFRRALDEEVAGGLGVAHAFGAALLALFLTETVTGLAMMMTYTPATDAAWSSVFWLQHRVTSGWFVRGLHHYGSEAMFVVSGLYLSQVLLWGAYRRPGEVRWWVVLAIFGGVQGAALTGFVLPWDQFGFWASSVRTNIAGSIPVVGPALQALVVGGATYGQATLTRFYTLHVLVVPVVLGGLLWLHGHLRGRESRTLAASGVQARPYYPRQFSLDVAFAAACLCAVAVLTAVMEGASLSAPADAARYFPARPEWFHRFLNKLMKLLPGALELLATAVLPGLATLYLVALPFIDRGKRRVLVLMPAALGFAGIVSLTFMSYRDDAADEAYQAAVVKADARAARAVELASAGIPPGGPLELLRNDPMSHGKDLFEQHCISCHILDGQGEREAPDHTGFGSRAWILRLLHDPDDDHFFGTTELRENMESMTGLGDEALKAVTEYVFALGHQDGDPSYDGELAKRGEVIFDDECKECHVIDGDGGVMDDGPNMTGYASLRWIRDQIAHPDAETQYWELNDMPAYDEQLSAHDIEMVARFLRKQRFAEPDWPLVVAGQDDDGAAEDGDTAEGAADDAAETGGADPADDDD